MHTVKCAQSVVWASEGKSKPGLGSGVIMILIASLKLNLGLMERNVQLLSKVSTPLHDKPPDSMLNLIHGIGYSSSGTAWIIDLMLVSKIQVSY